MELYFSFNSALSLTPCSFSKTPISLYELFDIKFLISLSFSTISLTETDCTLPADNPALTFLHRTGDSS